jgi:hypothetical protein
MKTNRKALHKESTELKRSLLDQFSQKRGHLTRLLGRPFEAMRDLDERGRLIQRDCSIGDVGIGMQEPKEPPSFALSELCLKVTTRKSLYSSDRYESEESEPFNGLLGKTEINEESNRRTCEELCRRPLGHFYNPPWLCLKGCDHRS